MKFLKSLQLVTLCTISARYDSYHTQIRSIRDIACHSPLVSIDIITAWVSSWTVPSTINDGQTDRRRFPGVPPGIRTLPIVPTVQGVPAGITSALGSDFRSISRSRYRPNKQRHCDHLRAFLSPSRVDSLSSRRKNYDNCDNSAFLETILVDSLLATSIRTRNNNTLRRI